MRRIVTFLIWAILCAAIYYCFFQGRLTFGWLEISIFTGVFTFLVYPYLLDLHLTFWRLFLDCYLDKNSFIYRMFYRGTFIRVMTLISSMVSSYLAFYTFFLAEIRVESMMVLAGGAFVLALVYDRTDFKVPILSGPLKVFFARYLTTFYIALACGAVLTALEAVGPEAVPLEQIFAGAIEVIGADRITFHPVRILARHEFALETLLQQMLDVRYVRYPAAISLFFSSFGASFSLMLAVKRAYSLPGEAFGGPVEKIRP